MIVPMGKLCVQKRKEKASRAEGPLRLKHPSCETLENPGLVVCQKQSRGSTFFCKITGGGGGGGGTGVEKSVRQWLGRMPASWPGATVRRGICLFCFLEREIKTTSTVAPRLHGNKENGRKQFGAWPFLRQNWSKLTQ